MPAGSDLFTDVGVLFGYNPFLSPSSAREAYENDQPISGILRLGYKL